MYIPHQQPQVNFSISYTSTMPLPFWTIGCIYGATSVGLGAFGAHGLKRHIADPTKIASWNTAAHYQVPPPYYSYHYPWIVLY